MNRSSVMMFVFTLILALSVTACQPATPADLSIAATVSDSSHPTVTAGTTIDIVMIFTAHHGSTNGVISFTDHLPDGLIFLRGSGPGIECTAEGQDVTCLTFGSLCSECFRVFDVVVEVDPRLSGTVVNTPKVLYAGDTNSANNTSTLTLTVASPNFATQALDFQMAKNAGALFPVSEIKNEKCARLGVGDWLDTVWDQNAIWDNGRHAGVEFIVDCGFNGAGQGEATVSAFQSFRLKNGWVVKSFTEDDWFVGDVAFTIDAAPQIGSCKPLLQVHIRSYGLSTRGSLPGPGSLLKVGMQIFIEGPAGTDPFSGSPSVFCEQ
jgi:hypothetical protein